MKNRLFTGSIIFDLYYTTFIIWLVKSTTYDYNRNTMNDEERVLEYITAANQFRREVISVDPECPNNLLIMDDFEGAFWYEHDGCISKTRRVDVIDVIFYLMHHYGACIHGSLLYKGMLLNKWDDVDDVDLFVPDDKMDEVTNFLKRFVDAGPYVDLFYNGRYHYTCLKNGKFVHTPSRIIEVQFWNFSKKLEIHPQSLIDSANARPCSDLNRLCYGRDGWCCWSTNDGGDVAGTMERIKNHKIWCYNTHLGNLVEEGAALSEKSRTWLDGEGFEIVFV